MRRVVLSLAAILIVVTAAVGLARRLSDPPPPTLDPASVVAGTIGGNAFPLPAGADDGTVSVVMSGPAAIDGSGGQVAYVLYNGTDQHVANVSLRVSFRDTAGTEVGDVDTTSANPYLIGPGGWGIAAGASRGAIADRDDLTAVPDIRWAAPAALPAEESLTITGLEPTPDGLVMRARNDGTAEILYPIFTVACVGDGGAIAAVAQVPLSSGTVRLGDLTVPAGAETALLARAELFPDARPCARLLVTGGGSTATPVPA